MNNMTQLPRLLKKILAGSLMGLTLTTAMAQADKPVVKVLVGFPAGAGTDALGRIYAEALSQILNVSAIVENKPGAGGLLANQALKQSSADSNSVMMTIDHQVVMLPLIMKNPGFDVKKDMVPVARVMVFNTCLAISASSPLQSLQAYVDAVKAKSDLGNYGIPALGSQAQFVGYVMGKQFKIGMSPIPYRGAAPAIIDLLGGQVPSVVVPCDALVEHRKAGKIRILAIAADQRSPALADVPTFNELGVKMPTDNFVAVYAAASMKPEMLRQITDATHQMFLSPKIVDKFNATGMTASYGAPEELNRIVERSATFWAEQVKQSNFQAQ
jgi:tripartite-type tricarboxylate transporter receptor subunit TctC